MLIKLNGKDFKINTNSNIQNLVDNIEIKDKFFVIEKNFEVVYKENYQNTYLKENDNIEIANFVGGG